jgi:sensor histidine kinase YesM
MMKRRLDALSPSLNRMITLSVLLALLAQIVLVYIGLRYAQSIGHSIDEKRTENVFSQIHQGFIYQLNDINNLLLLLQTPEFSDFFKNLMSLRDEATKTREKQRLLAKLNALNLSANGVDTVYFIGANANQLSCRLVAESSRLEELPRLHTDLLQHAKLEELFLVDHDQFSLYTHDDFERYLRTDSQLLNPEDIAGVKAFLSEIQDHLIITNGNANGVFIVIVLSDHFFAKALPDKTDGFIASVISEDDRILWSSAQDGFTRPGADWDSRKRIFDEERYASRIEELAPFRLRFVYTEHRETSFFFRTDLFLKMLALSLFALLATFFISLIYLKKVFSPFRAISRNLKNQFGRDGMELRPLPEALIRGGFHSISLRNKLILVLCAAVSIPAVSDGLLFSRFLTKEVEQKIETSVNVMGELAAVSIQNRVRFMENILNQISVSEKFQAYLTTAVQPNSYANNVQISMFPGLNDVSYFVLLDESGTCIYSSIFSNNKNVFDTNPKYLPQQNDPYWISNYKDVFNHISTAVVKRIEPSRDYDRVTYLLLVPKKSIFENVESGNIHVSYAITDHSGRAVYQSRFVSDLKLAEPLHFSEDIRDTNWEISIQYYFNEALEKYRVYQEQFLLCMFIVLLLSIGAALLIANLLARPIRLLKEAMLSVGAGEFEQRIDYRGNNEIAEIVQTFNKMIDQLNEMIQQNLRIMEENAKNKIKENHLMAMKTRAELLMLQAQINPHFLYNTLEAINLKSLKSGNTDISAMVSALADLFRYSVSKGTDFVPLEKELNHVANYVKIQQFRFGHSFALEFDIPDHLKNTNVMKFCLQPIVENSIKHGFAGWDSGGLIRITVSETDQRIQLSISDNGAGMDQQKLEQLTAGLDGDFEGAATEDRGIGLINVYQRLKLFYNEQVSMEIRSKLMRGTTVTLTFPKTS